MTSSIEIKTKIHLYDLHNGLLTRGDNLNYQLFFMWKSLYIYRKYEGQLATWQQKNSKFMLLINLTNCYYVSLNTATKIITLKSLWFKIN